MRAHRFGAIALILFAFAGAPGAKTSPPKIREWLDGPIRYIVTPEEIKEFKALDTESDRAAFVERFWRRRDPTPETLVNEYRQLFWQRVKETNEKFLDSARPGWRTDRGKIYILYGPPDEVKEDVNAAAGTELSDSRGLIRWVYLKPGGRRDVDPVVFVPFVRDVSGEYRVSYDPKLASPFFSWIDADTKRTAGLGNFLSGFPESRSGLGVMLDLGKLQEIPPQEVVLLESVEAVETFAFEPLPLAIQRFRPPGGEMLAVVTVSIPGSSAEGVPALIARFEPKSGGSRARILGEDAFRIAADGEGRVAQGRVALSNGAWAVTVLAVDAASGASRIYRGTVDPLPDGGGGPYLSDLVLARVLEPLPFAAQSSYSDPYIVGGFRVTPRAARALARGEPLQVFFEIYGGTMPGRLTYALEGQEDDGRWRSLGAPQVREASERGQAFMLPTGPSWPLGAYRLRVRFEGASGAPADGTIAWTLLSP